MVALTAAKPAASAIKDATRTRLPLPLPLHQTTKASISDRVYPLLPLSYRSTADADLSDWAVQIDSTADGAVTLVYDDELNERSGRRQRVVDVRCFAGAAAAVAIRFPPDNRFIGSSLPILNAQIKHVGSPLSIDVTIMDAAGIQRRIRTSNAVSSVSVTETSLTCPLALLAPTWNAIHIDMRELCQRVFVQHYAFIIAVSVTSSCRIRRVYLSDELYGDADLPAALRIYNADSADL